MNNLNNNNNKKRQRSEKGDGRGDGGGRGDGCDDDDGIVRSEAPSSPSPLPLPPGVLAPKWILIRPVVPEGPFSPENDKKKGKALRVYDDDFPSSLKQELQDLKDWWMRPINLERVGRYVQQKTATMREQRILCFLGFVWRFKCVISADDLCLALFLNTQLVESYLKLTDARGNQPATLVEISAAAIYAVKWLLRGTRDNNNPMASVLRTYMQQRNAFVAQAEEARKSIDRVDLDQEQRWLPWKDFVEVVGRLRKEWDEFCAGADGDDRILCTLEGASMLHDLLLLGLYSCIPGRGQETRLLEHISSEELGAKVTPKVFALQKKVNMIVCINGSWQMVLAVFKNVRSRGVDTTELQAFGWWTKLLEQYLEKFRPVLLQGQCHRFVFCSRSGKPFSESNFSAYVSTLIQRHTGKRVGTNLLRSSIITEFYDSNASADPALQASLANVMRHSPKVAKRIYDRSTSSEKKRKGLEHLASLGLK